MWQSKETNFVTKIVLGGELLYSIRNDAAIVGLKPETGELVRLIEIIPSQTPRENSAGYTTYYTIAATDKFIAAY